MAKHFINGQWHTELSRQITLNDCIRKMKSALAEYVEFHKKGCPVKEPKRKTRNS